MDSVAEPTKAKGFLGGLFGGNKRYEEEEDKDFEGFSFHGGPGADGKKSVLD